MAPSEPDSDSKRLAGQHEYVFSCPSSFNLSFAVWPVDDYTQKGALGKIRVRLKEGNIKAVKNLSGYQTFSGLPDDTYTLSVEPELYFPEERKVDTSTYSGSKEPVIEIPLKPRPLYPFPDRATLLRGMLAAENGLPAGITIKATAKEPSKVTEMEVRGIPDEKGEFVLYFRGPVKGKTEVTLEIKGEGVEKTLQAVVEEGHNTFVGVISI
ncbi:TPA: hypothetical protein HA351_13095 [Methanosarcinaceae archaeon]|nr:hypothetical protein [Methanosarcinaceae archaeon]